MESSTNGVIRGVFEALLNGAGVVSICAEFAESDELCLCGGAGVTKQNAESVHCHPQLLESCANFLTSLDVGRHEAGTSCRCIPPTTGWLAPNPCAHFYCALRTPLHIQHRTAYKSDSFLDANDDLVSQKHWWSVDVVKSGPDILTTVGSFLLL